MSHEVRTSHNRDQMYLVKRTLNVLNLEKRNKCKGLLQISQEIQAESNRTAKINVT